MKNSFKIIDLFAGPGGLGEGFSSFRDSSGHHPFKIALSIEKEASAHKTLQLRAFYRQFPDGEAPKAYYDYLAGKLGPSPDALYNDSRYRSQAQAAAEEARQFTLGEDNRSINTAIKKALGRRQEPWVLIGGPPCQAYSLVGRSRNRGIVGYDAQKDKRNFLYKEYLKVIAKFQPAVFVMENVKGILSAKIEGISIFDEIRKDLECPAKALGTNEKKQDYTVFSLTTHPTSSEDLLGSTIKATNFVIKAENYGIPQARHRVILLGVRNDLIGNTTPNILEKIHAPVVEEVIGDLPVLRSGLSKAEDSFTNWVSTIKSDIDRVIYEVRQHGLGDVAERMLEAAGAIGEIPLDRGGNWLETTTEGIAGKQLQDWYRDPSGWRGICNHETRGHIARDLHRYLFCACYSQSAKRSERLSPKAEEFPEALAPDHANWKSGNFSDRFRVQAARRVGTTVTSHISKDGHYFIHYDPTQCRSLTVREAARIQTFPDNYFFVGNRTQQYVQVGNAVPPRLAYQIAGIVTAYMQDRF